MIDLNKNKEKIESKNRDDINHLPKGYRLRDYEIIRVLGSGGFGVTYLAKHIELETLLAIKEFLPHSIARREEKTFSIIPFTNSKDENSYAYHTEKFLNEAKILASIRHANIVKVFHFFKENNTAYFIMDYVKGKSLKEYIKQQGSLDEEEIISIIMPILEGLKEVHNKHYLHRDIAPDNIYLRENSVPMLIDFGTVKDTEQNVITAVPIIKRGYSAPEQYSTSSELSRATDIYAIGAVLYTMISGKRPPESQQRQIEILNDKHDPLGDIEKIYGGRYSKQLLQTIKKAMSVKSADRFQSVAKIQSSLEVTSKPSWIRNIVLVFSIFIVGYLLWRKSNPPVLNHIPHSVGGNDKVLSIISSIPKTKLEWQDTPDVEKIKRSLENAKTYCKELKDGGFHWRLPTYEELKNRSKGGFKYNSIINKYWVSDEIPKSVNGKIFIAKNGGLSDKKRKTKRYSVRCVREITN